MAGGRLAAVGSGRMAAQFAIRRVEHKRINGRQTNGLRGAPGARSRTTLDGRTARGTECSLQDTLDGGLRVALSARCRTTLDGRTGDGQPQTCRWKLPHFGRKSEADGRRSERRSLGEDCYRVLWTAKDCSGGSSLFEGCLIRAGAVGVKSVWLDRRVRRAR